MSFLDKVIEKIGIVDEEYDEDGAAEGTGKERAGKAEADDLMEQFDESIPPEFLQHLQRKQVQRAEPEQENEGGQRVAPPVPRPVEKKAEPERKGIFGRGRKDSGDMNPVTALANALHVIIIRPEGFDDSQRIAEHLKNEQTVIVNYEKTDEIIAARINDFVCGVVYAIGGTIQKIDQKSMFCAPKTVNVDNKDMTSDKGSGKEV